MSHRLADPVFGGKSPGHTGRLGGKEQRTMTDECELMIN